MKKRNVITGITLMAMVLTACGGESKSTDKGTDGSKQPVPTAAVTKEPVELHFLVPDDLLMEVFMKQYGDAIQKKYPNFTFILTPMKDAQKLVTANTKIDVTFTSFAGFRNTVEPLGLMADMSDIVKSNNFDLARYEDYYLDLIRKFSNGKLTAMPFYDLRHIMYYNKDLFDKFGVPYPKDGLTWDETYEINKKMTRLENGIQYRGFGWTLGTMETNQASLSYVDPKTLTATLQTDSWKKYLEMLLPIYTTPGYNLTKANFNSALNDGWSKDKSVAMTVSFNSNAKGFTTSGINWDVVTLPEISGQKGVGAQPYPVYLSVASNSAHRNEAFQAIAILMSDEIQTRNAAEQAFYSPLKSPTVKAAFGRDVTEWKGKNIKAITTQKPAAMPEYLGFLNTKAMSAVSAAMISVVAGEKDMNTALREAQEQANIAIEAEKKK